VNSPLSLAFTNLSFRIDPKDDIIRGLFQRVSKEPWQRSPKSVATAVKDSSIVAIHWVDANEIRHFSIFYQDPKLHLREHSWNPDTETWDLGELVFEILLSINDTFHNALGDFNPGIQTRGTPISAEVVHGGDVEINVLWRDARGHAVSSSWSSSSGWDRPKGPNDGSQLLDAPARSVDIIFYNITCL